MRCRICRSAQSAIASPSPRTPALLCSSKQRSCSQKLFTVRSIRGLRRQEGRTSSPNHAFPSSQTQPNPSTPSCGFSLKPSSAKSAPQSPGSQSSVRSAKLFTARIVRMLTGILVWLISLIMSHLVSGVCRNFNRRISTPSSEMTRMSWKK